MEMTLKSHGCVGSLAQSTCAIAPVHQCTLCLDKPDIFFTIFVKKIIIIIKKIKLSSFILLL